MVTVQMRIGSTDTDRRNGSNHSTYQGYTTGAHSSAAAIGHANACGGKASDLLPSQFAVNRPTRTANPATNHGFPTCSRAANTGPLKRNLRTYALSDPPGMCPPWRNGM